MGIADNLLELNGYFKIDGLIDGLRVTVDLNIPDFSKSPFIIKKVERARELVAKYGLSKESKPKKSK